MGIEKTLATEGLSADLPGGGKLTLEDMVATVRVGDLRALVRDLERAQADPDSLVSVRLVLRGQDGEAPVGSGVCIDCEQSRLLAGPYCIPCALEKAYESL